MQKCGFSAMPWKGREPRGCLNILVVVSISGVYIRKLRQLKPRWVPRSQKGGLVTNGLLANNEVMGVLLWCLSKRFSGPRTCLKVSSLKFMPALFQQTSSVVGVVLVSSEVRTQVGIRAGLNCLVSM